MTLESNCGTPHESLRRRYRRALSPDLSGFVEFLEDLTDCIRDPQDLTDILARRLRRMLRRPELIPESFLSHPPDQVGRNIVIRGDRYAVLCFTWPPRSASPIHDHGTWGVVGVLQNRIGIREFSRLDGGSRAGHARLRRRRDLEVRRGEVGIVLPPRCDIHQMTNPTDRLSVTLHVYGKEIRRANRFDLVRNRVEPYALRYTNE